MGKPLSEDLRKRVVAAVAAGGSRREAAARFGVSASSAIGWTTRLGTTGSVKARPMGGTRQSRLAPHRETVLELLVARPDQTLEELRAALAARGVRAGYGSVWRFLRAERITFKKNRARRRTDAARRRPRPVALDARAAEA